MATLFLSLLFLFQPQVDKGSKVEWLSATSHDFGDISRGVPVPVDFRFRNITKEALVIDNIRTTCGCTASEWSEEVVEPGKEGVIQIEFDAKKEGYFYKKITVFFSGQRKGEKLSIEGYVE